MAAAARHAREARELSTLIQRDVDAFLRGEDIFDEDDVESESEEVVLEADKVVEKKDEQVPEASPGGEQRWSSNSAWHGENSGAWQRAAGWEHFPGMASPQAWQWSAQPSGWGARLGGSADIKEGAKQMELDPWSTLAGDPWAKSMKHSPVTPGPIQKPRPTGGGADAAGGAMNGVQKTEKEAEVEKHESKVEPNNAEVELGLEPAPEVEQTKEDNTQTSPCGGADDDELGGLVSALQELIETYEGTLPGTAFEKLYDKSEAYRSMVKAAGGPKRFAEQHSDRFTWTFKGLPGGSVQLADGRGWSRPTAAPYKPIGAAWSSPSWTAPSWTQAAWKPVQSHGGASELEKIAGSGVAAGLPWPEASDTGGNSSLRRALIELIQWENGSILASKVFITIRSWKPKQFAAMKKEADDAGSLKDFVSVHADTFEWIHDRPGTDSIRLAEGQCDNLAVQALKELLRKNDGSMKAAQIFLEGFLEKHNLDPIQEQALRAEVRLAGGVKKFVVQYPEHFAWFRRCGVGSEAIALAGAGAPTADGDAAAGYRPEEYAEETWDMSDSPVPRRVELAGNNAAADVLCELLRYFGGTLLACQLYHKLKVWDFSKLEIVKAEAAYHGSLRLLISQHSDRIEWFLHDGAGTESVRLVHVPSTAEVEILQPEHHAPPVKAEFEIDQCVALAYQ
mmetsp:Transcript_25858/g.86045  ORF Transcript_25858/g.86045 Transcript_25858/m.86045 type:complete len:678 (-) Transcript_25858:770-2803(-)|eukprot:CAMPEP_0203850686 /NCGR_PEP_ID=MMETSP0359-20131031/6902_1 /ASSEMBLY_ACC=CAM_ASM_000338 /TAXON_ID=268821 /ORGANISM="Scrippsiella Hangoei, Strain SHTV-5" /LENGTH=677 /DNA_ID=CAMNT_0050766599 /DNA_START=38 /DNA_END=2071 /DNA_ORIENTATION=+